MLHLKVCKLQLQLSVNSLHQVKNFKKIKINKNKKIKKIKKKKSSKQCLSKQKNLKGTKVQIWWEPKNQVQ